VGEGGEGGVGEVGRAKNALARKVSYYTILSNVPFTSYPKQIEILHINGGSTKYFEFMFSQKGGGATIPCG